MDLHESDKEFIERFEHFVKEDVKKDENCSMEEKPRYMAVLASLIGCQGLDAFKELLPEALEAKLSPLAIKEIVYQSTAYVGYGRMLPFLEAVNEIYEEKEVEVLLESMATTTLEDRLDKGALAQSLIFGDKMKEAWKEGPINRWLAANCFGDYYTRRGMDLAEREMVTFCLLAAQGGCESQLTAHARANMDMGNDKDFLMKVVSQNLPYIGYPRSLNAISCIERAAEMGDGKQ